MITERGSGPVTVRLANKSMPTPSIGCIDRDYKPGNRQDLDMSLTCEWDTVSQLAGTQEPGHRCRRPKLADRTVTTPCSHGSSSQG